LGFGGSARVVAEWATRRRRAERADAQSLARVPSARTSGITYYWEHLGLLSDPAYAQRWATKRKAYLAEGVQPVESANGADRVLIETTEAEGAGLDMLEIERLA